MGTLTVAKAPATVTLGSLTQAYDGTPRWATATTTPVGLAVTFSYTGTSTGGITYWPSATAPTNAGTYSVTATITDANYQGSATGTLTVGTWWQALTGPDGTLTTWKGAYMSEGWQPSVTDVDGDGRDDVLLYRPTDGVWFTAISTGPGTFKWTAGTWGAGWTVIASR